MLVSSVELLRQKAAFWRGPRTKAALGRVTHATDWEPRWAQATPSRESPDLLSARRSARTHRLDLSNEEPYVSVYWETERALSPGLQDALVTARFATSCRASIPQHVCYTWDNNLYLMNYLKALCPVLFESDVGQAIVTLPATILANTTIYPIPDIIPCDPVAVIVVATANQIVFFGLYPETDPFVPDDKPRTHVCLVNQSSGADDENFTHEIVTLRLTEIPKYNVNTNGRIVSCLVGDESGRLFVCFEDDGLGVHELIYRSKGSLFSGPLTLRRLVKPNGAVASRRVTDGSSVLCAIESAFSEAQSAVSRMLSPQPPEGLAVDVRFLLAQTEDVLITIDSYSTTRVYLRHSPETPPISTKKRKKPQTSDQPSSPISQETSMLSSSPPRKRRLDNGEAQSVRDGGVRESQESQSSSSSGGLELVCEFSLPFLACEFFKSNHFDARFLSAQGFGAIAEATLSASLSPRVSILTLTTTSARKIELALDASDPDRFQFGLLGVYSIDIPSDRLQSELPSPVLGGETATPRTRVEELAQQVSHSFTKSWKFGPIFVCTFSRTIPDQQASPHTPAQLRPSHMDSVNVITLGLHPSVAPLSMCRAPQNDGFMTFETSESVRMIIDANSAWVSSLNFREEAKASRLPDGSGLLDIGLENCLLRVGAQDALMRGTSLRSTARSSTPFHRTFWVFHDTFFRKLHIKWGGLDLLPPLNSLPLSLLDNLDMMSHPSSSAYPKVVLHPDDGNIESADVMTRRSTELGVVSPILPSPSVEALSDLLSHLFADILEQPLFARATETDRLVVTWPNFSQVWLLCKRMVKLLETHRSHLLPSVLSSSKEAAEAGLIRTSENFWLPLKGKGQLESICSHESKKALIFVHQRRQLSGLAAFVNMMSQIGTVVNTLNNMSESWRNWTNDNVSLTKTLENSMDETGETLFPRLLSEPLAHLLVDKNSLLPLSQLTQSLLEILTELTVVPPDSSAWSPEIKADALAYMRVIVKNCGWLMCDNTFQVALRQRLSHAALIEQPGEKAEALVGICLQLLPDGTNGLMEARTLREKCHLVRAVLNALVIETGALDFATILTAHLLSTQAPEDHETYLDELYACLQRLFKRIVNAPEDFMPALSSLSEAFRLLHSPRLETEELEKSFEKVSVTPTSTRSLRPKALTDLFTTSTARLRVSRTIVRAILDQLYEETEACVLDSSRRGLPRRFAISPAMRAQLSPENLTDLIFIKYCHSAINDNPARESEDTLHLRISTELLRRSTPGFDHELLQSLKSANLKVRLSAMTALIFAYSLDSCQKEKSSQMAKVLLSQLPEISRHPHVSSEWFSQMASRCLNLNESLASGVSPREGATALDSLVESECLGSGLTIADGNKIWVTVHKRWRQLIQKHRLCVVPLLEWIAEVLKLLAVPIPSFGEEEEKSGGFFSRSDPRIRFHSTDVVPLSETAAAILSHDGRSHLQAAFTELIDRAVAQLQSGKELTEHMRTKLADLYTLTSSAASYLSVGELLTLMYPAGALHIAARCLVVTWEPTLEAENHSMISVMVSEFGQVLTVSALSPMRGLSKLTDWKTLWRGPLPAYLDADDVIAVNVYATMNMLLSPGGIENQTSKLLKPELAKLTHFMKLIGLAWFYTHRNKPTDWLTKNRRFMADILNDILKSPMPQTDDGVQPAAIDSFMCLVEDTNIRRLAEKPAVLNQVWNLIACDQLPEEAAVSSVRAQLTSR